MNLQRNANLSLPGIRQETFNELIEHLIKNCGARSVDERKTDGAHFIQLIGAPDDRLTFTHYRTRTLLMQGKAGFLYHQAEEHLMGLGLISNRTRSS